MGGGKNDKFRYPEQGRVKEVSGRGKFCGESRDELCGKLGVSLDELDRRVVVS